MCRSRQPCLDWIQGCALKPPAFQFYADDFLGGTIAMSNEEKGLYITLLCVQWSQGSVSGDDFERLAGGSFLGSIERVKSKFQVGQDGLYRNERMELERQKQAAFRAACAAGGKRGGGNPNFKKGQRNPYVNKGGLSIPLPEGDKGRDKGKINSPISDLRSPSPPPDPKVPVLAQFERFWSAYPRKVGKQKALSAFVRHKCSGFIEKILTAIEAQKRGWEWQKDGGQFIPYPERWLNGGHWDNGVSAPPTNGKPSSDDRAIRDMERLL